MSEVQVAAHYSANCTPAKKLLLPPFDPYRNVS